MQPPESTTGAARTTDLSSDGQPTGLSIGQYLIKRLHDYGVRDVFGIPGDYVLAFYRLLGEGPLKVVGWRYA
jgi:indolepyruvate decarboxylase